MSSTDWSYVDNTELDEEDFQDVRDAVAELAGLWWPFASVLGLSPSALREIDEANRGKPAQCLFDAIDRWIRQDYNHERYGPSSWRKLVIAVESSIGGQNAALAKKIAQSHSITQDPMLAGEPAGGYEEALPETMPSEQSELGPQPPHCEQPTERPEPTRYEQPVPMECVPSPHRDESSCRNEPAAARAIIQPSIRLDKVISMKDLQNDLAPIAHKWYNIGLQLGITAHDLDKVSREGNDSQRLLSDMLGHWLSNNCDARRSDLENMLKSKTIGEAKLARKLLKVGEIPEDSDGPLKEAHIKALVEFLNPVASRWEDIGIQLGINPRDLDTLKQRGGTTVEAALNHTLKKLDSLEPPKTVGDLFEALSSSTVAEKVYAEHLRDKYGCGYLLHAPASDCQEDRVSLVSECSEHACNRVIV